jgi:hypothetical protein
MFAKGCQELRIKKRILEEAIVKATGPTNISLAHSGGHLLSDRIKDIRMA